MLSAAKGKKEKKAIRHRGVGAPNKGMSRNRSRDSMGLIGPGKTMLRSGPLQGSGAPTSTREWDLPSHGFSRQLRCPKVSKGERREAGIQWIQPPKAVSDPEFRQTTSGAHGSANRADCLPRGKPFGAPAGAKPFSCRGLDAPTAAREQGLQPYGALTLFFRWRKKSVQKKASGTATPGKRLLLPILTAGLATSRAP